MKISEGICGAIWVIYVMSNDKLAPFDSIWNRVIYPVFSVVREECSPEFVKDCSLDERPSEEWRKEVYSKYLRLRKQLKDICYGSSNHSSDSEPTDEDLLDGRKIAAVLCSALIHKKAFRFQTGSALKLTKEKKQLLTPEAFNQWAVSNIYINYKLAYYASLQMVYLTLVYDLLEKSEDKSYSDDDRKEAKALAAILKDEHHLCTYTLPSTGDGFDVNIVIGLARTDLAKRDLDTFLFAMQLYQVESHTIDVLRRRLK